MLAYFKFFSLLLFFSPLAHAADYDQIIQILDAQAEVERSKLVSEAKKGSLEHQYKLGVFYYRGGDVIAARGWLTQAAEKGYAPAQAELSALLVDRNYEDTNNPSESLDWLMKAAQGGYAEAKHGLSIRYQYGKGGAEKNERKALEWLISAAESGQPSAQAKFGRKLILGDGVNKDEIMGYVWLLRSKDNGSPLAVVYIENFSPALSPETIGQALDIFYSISE